MDAAGIGGLFLALTMNLSAHFEILQRRIRTLVYKDSDVDEKIKKIVEYHNGIMDLCSDISHNFAVLLIVQFVYFIGEICIVAFTLLLMVKKISF